MPRLRACGLLIRPALVDEVGELLQDRRAFNGENFRDASVDSTRVSHVNGVGLTLRQSPGRSGSGAQVASRWAQRCDSGRVGRDTGSKVENRDAEQTMRGTRILSVERPSTGKRQTDQPANAVEFSTAAPTQRPKKRRENEFQRFPTAETEIRCTRNRPCLPSNQGNPVREAYRYESFPVP